MNFIVAMQSFFEACIDMWWEDKAGFGSGHWLSKPAVVAIAISHLYLGDSVKAGGRANQQIRSAKDTLEVENLI
jgi:hypothetical protein